MSDVVYRLDREHRFVFVNEAWDRFAIANDAPELAGGAVLGTPLMSHIWGSEARQLTHALIERARAAGGPLTIPFRCDAPGERRRMRMIVTVDDAGVEFRTRVDSTEARPAVDVLDRRVHPRDELLTVCAWCKRARAGNAWMELEAAAEALRLFELSRVPALTHGICDACVVAVAGSSLGV